MKRKDKETRRITDYYKGSKHYLDKKRWFYSRKQIAKKSLNLMDNISKPTF
jgi:hypothetical protein